MEHINFFSGASLANLMRTRGFEPVFSEKVLRQYTDVTMMPSVHAVFEDRGAPVGTLVRDDETERRLASPTSRIHARWTDEFAS